jgi:hypothetical protein
MSADGSLYIPPAWTPARIALLVEHYQAGMSAVDSARLIGAVSKNAVISKRRRLGLMAAATVRPESAGVAPDAAARRHARIGRARLFRGPPPLPIEPLPEMDGPPPPGAAPCLLTERRLGACAWPLGPAEVAGDHRTLFCGASAPGARYCPAHAARAYRSKAAATFRANGVDHG